MKPEDQKSSIYNDHFYSSQVQDSFNSATRFTEIMTDFYLPKSIIDIGCGRGAWLKAFSNIGSDYLVGIDGAWNSQENMIEPKIIFKSCDLENIANLDLTTKFDLAISLEVAEHLPESCASIFIDKLCSLSDAVLFGAAIPGQGGTSHINEQFSSFWASIFLDNEYRPFDIFRSRVWNDPNVKFWYQQNSFLYLRNDSDISRLFLCAGVNPVANLSSLDYVHPILYRRTLYQLEEANHQLIESTPVRNFLRKILQLVSNFKK